MGAPGACGCYLSKGYDVSRVGSVDAVCSEARAEHGRDGTAVLDGSPTVGSASKIDLDIFHEGC